MDTIHEPSKKTIVTLFEKWIKQRPGLEWCNYDCGNWRESRRCYDQELRGIIKDRHRALTALDRFECVSYDWNTLQEAFKRAYSGRLSINYKDGKGWFLDYCTGQYWPTEYRQAAASVLEWYVWAVKRMEE